MIRMQGTPNQSAAGSPAYLGRTGGIRILFVEDDEFYRENLVAELTERGFVVHSFTDATWLLRSLDSAVEADVIVLEWKLPNILGIDLLAQLRHHGVNLPVVFLTNHAQIENESQAFARGGRLHQQVTRCGDSSQPPQGRVGDWQTFRPSRGRQTHRLRQARPQTGEQPSLLERGGRWPHRR